MQLDDDGARRLVAAVILRAVLDTQRGNRAALTWLVGDGVLWCEAVCGFRLDLRKMALGRPTGFERMAAAIERNPELTDGELATLTGLTPGSVTAYRSLLRGRQPGHISTEMRPAVSRP